VNSRPPDSSDDRPVARATAASRAAAQRLLSALASALALSLLLALFFAAIARADVPDVRFCVADSNLVASPDGGFGYTVLLRDNTNSPIPNATVVLDFTSAPGILVCGSQDQDHDGRLLGTTNSSGSVTFTVKAGGTTFGRVWVGTAIDLIVMAWPRTTDFDADSDVDASDQAALNSLMGTSGPAGDFDRNGTVNAADAAILNAHLGGTCSSTPAYQQSWGALKAQYR
jgi:hypothetical protein